MKINGCDKTLVLRLRRGLCSATEAAEIERHLLHCRECRWEHAIGAAFDDAGTLEPDDGTLIARAAERAARATRGTAAPAGLLPRRLSKRVIGYAFAVTLLAGGASAGLWHRSGGWLTGAPDGERTPTRPRPSASAEKGLAGTQPTTPPVAASVPEPGPSVPSPLANDGALPPSRSVSRTLHPPVEARATLFESANRARRGGEQARAIALYQELQRRYPSSAEAHLSRVSLGRLSLDTGAAGNALQQFDAYLARPDGALRIEALTGRAQALSALGRRKEERSAWEQVVREFPGSVQAGHARRRLNELSR